MIDVELVSCITNSPLLHRQRAERKRGRMKSIQLIKVEDSGIRFFLSSTLPSLCLSLSRLLPYLAGKMAWAGALKAAFNGC